MPNVSRLLVVACGFLAFSAPAALTAAHATPVTASCAAQEEEENAGGATPAHLSDKFVVRGQEIGVSGDCFTPGETVDVEFHTAAVLVGTTEADGSGTASTTVTIPRTAQCGAHTITMTGEGSGHVAGASLRVACLYHGAYRGSGPPADNRRPTAVQPSSTTQQPAQPVSTLPFTGSDSVPLSAAGAAFLFVGGFLLAAGRRRYLARHAARG